MQERLKKEISTGNPPARIDHVSPTNHHRALSELTPERNASQAIVMWAAQKAA
jgi:hypothetical protein